jgi:hypothetical protein
VSHTNTASKSQTPPKGRPTPRQRKTTQAYGYAPTPPSSPDSLSTTPFGYLWRTCVAGAAMALFTPAIFFVPAAADNTTVVLALLCIPALLTMIFVPRARTQHLYRWPIVWLLGFTSQLAWSTLIVAQTWVLIRFWYVEARPQMPKRRASQP